MANTDRPAVRPKGIPCPVCTCRLRTAETRRRSDGSVRRVKVCSQCGHRVHTVERVVAR